MSRPPTVLLRLALATLAPLLALGLVEAGFRVAGFTYQPSPMDLLVTGADPLSNATVVDEDVFWTLRRSQRYRFADLEIVTNELGTRDPLPPRAKPPGTIRIVCLGDSTAFGGHTTYPAQLEQVLRACAPDVRVEVINAGVPGWSTYQGVRLFQRDLVAWQPDIVTASFGFNNAKSERDGLTDRQRAASMQTSALRAMHWLGRSRFVQWLVKQRDARRDLRVKFDGTRDWQQLRCPPADLARCLAELDATCRGIGAKLLLASQPHGFTWKEGDATGTLSPAAIKDVAARLDEQNAVVARSAAELHVAFVDVAAQFRELEAAEVFVDPLPGVDPLHTSAFGARRVAEALADAAFESRWIESSRRTPIRPFRTCGPIASLATDVDGDGDDEVVLAAVVDGRPSVRVFDPSTGTTHELTASLPTPDAGFELVQVPLLTDSLLLAVPVADPEGCWLLAAGEGGSVRPFAPKPMALPQGVAYQVVPLELTGEGAAEYAVCATGPGGAPWILVLSSTGQPSFSRSAKRDGWSAGVRLAAIEDGPGKQAIAVTPSGGPAFVLKVTVDGRVETLLAPKRIAQQAPTELVAGRFASAATGSDPAMSSGDQRFLLVQAPMLLAWQREFLGAAYFPFGSGRFDRDAPRPVLTRITRDGEPVLILGLRVGDTIHLFRIDGQDVVPWSTVEVPRAP